MLAKHVITGIKLAREHEEDPAILLSQQWKDEICKIIQEGLTRAGNQNTGAIVGRVKSALNKELGTTFASPGCLATYIHQNVFATKTLNKSYLLSVIREAMQQLRPQEPESSNSPEPGTVSHSAD